MCANNMQKHSKSSLFSIFVSRSSTVLSRISIWSIEAPIKRTRGAQRGPQKTTEKVPFLFWGGLQDMFSIVDPFSSVTTKHNFANSVYTFDLFFHRSLQLYHRFVLRVLCFLLLFHRRLSLVHRLSL